MRRRGDGRVQQCRDVVCPDCGQTVASLGLASHRRGNACTVMAVRREQQNSGRVPVAQQYARMLDTLGVPYELAEYNWHPGGPGRKGTLTYALWVAADVARAVTDQRHPADVRLTYLKALASLTDPDARDALQLAASMDTVTLRTHLRLHVAGATRG